MECSVDTRISSLLSGDRDELRVDIVDLGFCLVSFFFGCGDSRSASHSVVVQEYDMSIAKNEKEAIKIPLFLRGFYES